MEFDKIRTYPIGSRRNKFTLASMIPLDSRISCDDKQIVDIARRIREAREKGAGVILMIGGAVIKEGCSLLLIDLMEKGLITHLAMNGSVPIHDFEIAMIGATSEDVEGGLADGSFGMAEETGREMNRALARGFVEGKGYGESLAAHIRRGTYRHKDYSILYQADCLNVGVSVHTIIGAEIIHQHPSCDGAALGATSYADFRTFTRAVGHIGGGVILNVGSAVVMPEVFLKALTISRNLGFDLGTFTVANFDFLDMYRSRTRVVEWPRSLGARTYDIRGRHNRTIPSLRQLMVDADGANGS